MGNCSPHNVHRRPLRGSIHRAASCDIKSTQDTAAQRVGDVITNLSADLPRPQFPLRHALFDKHLAAIDHLAPGVHRRLLKRAARLAFARVGCFQDDWPQPTSKAMQVKPSGRNRYGTSFYNHEASLRAGAIKPHLSKLSGSWMPDEIGTVDITTANSVL